MKMYLISDNIDTWTGMRLAGVEGAGAEVEPPPQPASIEMDIRAANASARYFFIQSSLFCLW